MLLVLAAFIALGRVALALIGLRALWAKSQRTELCWLATAHVAVGGLSIAAGADGWLGLPGMRLVNVLEIVLGLALVAKSFRPAVR